ITYFVTYKWRATWLTCRKCVSGKNLRRNESRTGTLNFARALTSASGPRKRKAASVRGSLAHETRSEEHTSELQSLMRISYAVLCLTKKKTHMTQQSLTM